MTTSASVFAVWLPVVVASVIGCYGRGGNGQVTGSSGCDAVTHCFPLTKKITTDGAFGVLVFPLA